MNTYSLSFVKWSKWGVVFSLAFGVVMASVLFLTPKATNSTRAESCSPLYDYPVFNPYPISPSQDQSTGCDDLYTIAVHKDGESSASYRKSVDANVGDEIWVRIYAHNGARQDLGDQTTAHEVKAEAQINGGNITAYLTGSNIASLTDSVNIQLPAGAHLEGVEGSGETFDANGNSTGATTVNQNGGWAYFGDQQACFEFARFMRFKVRVVGAPVQQSSSLNASLGSKIDGQCVWNGNVDWSTTGYDNVQVFVVNPDTGAEQLMASSDNGSAQPNWIEPNKNFVFRLKSNGQTLREANISGSGLSCGSTPTPTPTQTTGSVTVTNNNTCPPSVRVSWTTQNASAVAVFNDTTGAMISGDFNGNVNDPGVQANQNYSYSIWNVDWSNGGSKVSKVATSNSVAATASCTTPTVTPSANITASLGSKIDGQCLWNATVNWTTSNVQNPKVYVKSIVSPNEQLMSASDNGTANPNWIGPNDLTTFTLRGDNISEKVATVDTRSLSCNSPTPTATITATLGSKIDGQCLWNATVTWSTSNVVNPKVYVKSVVSPTEQLMSASDNGTANPNWIGPSDLVTFTLRGGNIADKTATVSTQGLSCNTTPSTFTATATATASATATCAGGSSATASASASATATSNVSQADAQSKAQTQAQAQAQANAQAQASASCTPAPTGPLTCVASPNPVMVNQPVNFTVSGGNGPFTWNLNGATGGTNSGSSATGYKYSTFGLKQISVSNSAGQSGSCTVVVNEPTNVCTSNTGATVTADVPVRSGNLYSTTVRWQSSGSNGIKIGMGGTTNIIVSGQNTGSVQINNMQPGTSYVFYMIDNSCGTTLASVVVNVPSLPVETPTNTTNNNSNNTQTNNTNQNSTGNYSPNQNNSSNINGNNNTVTQTNNNCVNNSCNNAVYYVSTSGTTVPYTQYSELSIRKLVRDVTVGTSYANSVTANNNDIVEFQITVTATAGTQAVQNVRVSDTLPSGLSFLSGTTRVDNSFVSDGLTNGNIYLGSLSSGASKVVTFQARVNSNTSVSLQNTATATGDNVRQVQDSAWVFVNPGNVQGGNVALNYSKKAWNDTKGVDATSVNASKEDYITYTLTVSNSGNAPANSFVITDDLSGVLPYADMVDNGGGSLNGNVISYPGITIPAGGSVSKSFKVRIKYFLADNLSYVLTNTYGNTVTIHINTPQVKGAFIAPKTGADSLGIVFSAMMTAGFAIARKRKDIFKAIFA